MVAAEGWQIVPVGLDQVAQFCEHAQHQLGSGSYFELLEYSVYVRVYGVVGKAKICRDPALSLIVEYSLDDLEFAL